MYASSLFESHLRHNTSLHILLQGDAWAADVGTDATSTHALLGALRSQQEHVSGDDRNVGYHAPFELRALPRVATAERCAAAADPC
jgi:hypothetical protein